MRHFNHILFSVAIAVMLGLFSKADAQAPTYYGPLLYSISRWTPLSRSLYGRAAADCDRSLPLAR